VAANLFGQLRRCRHFSSCRGWTAVGTDLSLPMLTSAAARTAS